MQEFWFYVGQGGEINKSVAVTEETAVEVKDKGPNKDMIMAITSGDGPLAPGACPKVGGLGDVGEKNILEAIGGTVTKAKKRKLPKNDDAPAEVVEPKTPKEEISEVKDEILKSATEARKHALGLKHINYSGELVSGLMDFSAKMESIYETVASLLTAEVDDEAKYKKILKVIKEKMQWYKSAEARYLYIVSSTCRH